MRSTLRWIALLFTVSVLGVHGEVAVTLRKGDLFEMRLSGMPAEYAAAFAVQYTVNQDGTVHVPLLGEMKAAGMTASQLERSIQSKLVADKVFTHPTVLISVPQTGPFVSISGGVSHPGRLPWSPDLTLAAGIANCIGLDGFHDPIRIRLIRKRKLVGVYSFLEILRDPSKDAKLLPGDQVIVPE
jgi:polysaccharide export outer membrane protein